MKKNEVMLILVPTLIFVVVWIIFTVYHNSTTSTVSDEINLQITPISPNFDTETIEKLKTRQTINPLFVVEPEEEEEELQISPTPIPLLISTPSALPATASGESL